MWVIYKKSDKTVVGVSALGRNDPEKGEVLKEVVQGLLRPGEPSEYDALQITDLRLAQEYMEAFPHRLVVTGGQSKPRLVIRDPETFALFIESDSEDKHPVDGIPEIPANGSSSTLLTITKIDERFKPQQGEGDNEELFLRTDHGIIRDEKGKRDINKVQLKKGQAKIRLFSETFKRVATLQVITNAPYLNETTFRVEFS